MEMKNSGPVDLSSEGTEPHKAKVVVVPYNGYGNEEKVIQPLDKAQKDAEVVSPENQASPVQNPDQPVKAGSIDTYSPTPQKKSKLWSNLNFIYPDAKAGPDIEAYQPLKKKELPQLDYSKSKLALLKSLVIILAVVMLVASALNLFSWVRVGSSDGAIGVLALIILTIDILLEVGIILRSNIVRAIFVFLSMLFLVFSIFSTYSYFKDVRNQQKANQAIVAQINQQIAHTKSDTSYSSAQINQVVSSLKLNERLEQQPTLRTHNILLPISESYFIAIVPIVFLTRKPVKTVFR
ncbi:MAG TPA: hypothetical protein VMR34_06035 [Candidatus Saccharimonadales bacterium]|nr:hypothetical protein [Candidatus Saccharimonadales bacterium]